MRRNNIPDGWLLKKLNQISTFESGGTPSKGVDEFWVNGDIKWLSAKYIDQDKIIGCDYITKQGLDNSSAKMTKFGDIILVTRVSVGKIVFVEEEFAVNQDLTIIKTDDTNKKFLFYVLKNKTKDIIDKSQGLAIKGITKEELSNIKVLVPPLPEQKKIAEILGTWDRAIEELTDLIAEKKELKRGLMQRLLTGTQRLPGFTKPWNNTKLGDIGIITSAGVDKKSIEGEKAVKLLNYMDVYKKDFLFASDVNMDVTASDRQIANCNLKRGDVFFTPSSETRDDIAHSAVVMEDVVNGVYSYHIIRLRPTIDIDMKYTAYAFKTGMFYKQAYALCEGSGQRYVLSQNYFRNMKIYIPSDSAEQKAIADVLSKADAEIDLLNLRLDVLKEQKCGLMQKLLTGEIRVKVDME